MNQLSTFFDHAADIARQENISLDEALQEVKKLGIDLLEVSQNNLGEDPLALGDQLAKAGLSISTIPAYFNFGTDPDVETQSLPTLEAAKALGVDKILVIPGFIAPEVTDPDARKAQRDNMAAGINRLGELAAKYGVEMTMEDFDNERAPFSDAKGVRGFLDDCPALYCAFDTGNFRFMANESELEAFALLRDRIRYVHLKDRAYTGQPGEWARPARDGQKLYASPVGYGEMKIEEIIEMLKEDGYQGAYSIEHYGAPKMLEYLTKSAGWVKARLA